MRVEILFVVCRCFMSDCVQRIHENELNSDKRTVQNYQAGNYSFEEVERIIVTLYRV